MQNKNVYLIYFSLIAFVLVLVIVFLYGRFHQNIDKQKYSTSTTGTISTVTNGAVSTSSSKNKPYTIEVLPNKPISTDTSGPIGTALSLRVIYGRDFDKKSQAEKDMIISNIKDISVVLEKDFSKAEYWLELGIYRRMAGDFTGALEVWNYFAKMLPGNVPVQLNIAELYAYDLKDIAKAEEAYKKAISNNPTYFQAYASTFDFYRSIYPKTDKAEKILLEGIAATKGNLNLITSLASYYKYNERWSDAITYYQKALDIAVSLKRVDMQGSFQTEIDELRTKIK